MQRLIKFRAVDTLGNLVYGIPNASSTLHLTLDSMAQYFTEQRLYGRQNVKIKPETVGQFTGLHDKNGKEIYEGDIIKGETRNFTVKFEEGMFTTDVGKFILHGDYEIIGNIHQNPELLDSSAKADA